jgi:exopolyphosphatase/guanosine-5'-triphosphate,3'-diphosphate pyrophosphatase
MSRAPDGIAVVDLGSNSFHLMTARLVGGEPNVIDRLREPVQLAAGLDSKRRLRGEVATRALQCLARFGQRLREIPNYRVRVIGTNTFRVARDAADFVERAERALGHPIEVVSGAEEARLIYLGVSHTLPDDGRGRLVVDIGGGSTECILGRGFEILDAHSLHMGCVGYAQRYFPGGRIDKKAMDAAVLAARRELQTLQHRFAQLGWDEAVGSSGTIRAARDVIIGASFDERGLTARGVRALRKAVLAHGDVDALDFEGLRRDRASVFPAGVAILSAMFDTFDLSAMAFSEGSLREGVVYDLLGRFRHEDIRERTIRIFQERYHVDAAQAARVERSAERVWQAVAASWRIAGDEVHNWLRWAARLHEIGLSVSYRNHHHHGRYLLENSDMPGFARNDQRALAALVGSHRRRIRHESLDTMPTNLRPALRALIAVLRLAVVLNRSRAPRTPGPFRLEPERDRLTVRYSADFARRHPLTVEDLAAEIDEFAALDLRLRLKEMAAENAEAGDEWVAARRKVPR